GPGAGRHGPRRGAFSASHYCSSSGHTGGQGGIQRPHDGRSVPGDAGPMSRAAMTWALIGGLLAGAAITLFWFGPNWFPRETSGALRSVTPLSDDPRVTYDGPLLNVRLSIPYVGDGVCAECHFDKAESYHSSAMGRSLLPIGQLA